jgi:predicted RNA methylase
MLYSQLTKNYCVTSGKNNTVNIFDNQPGFITRDPRTAQADERAFSAESQQARYEAWIPPEFLKGASVLDLGCCCGAVGGYVLAHGAKRYVGVEISTALSKLAIQNLDEYHPDANYWIEIKSAEDYLETAAEQFDFVIIAGILHGVTELTPFLIKASELGQVVIIESVHPPLPVFEKLAKLYMEAGGDAAREEVHKAMQYIECVMPFSLYHNHGRMCLEDTQSAVTNILRPLISIGALNMIFDRLGFVIDIRPYQRLITALPKYFGFSKRFGVAFVKRGLAKPMSFKDLYESDSKEITAWDEKNTEGMI